MDGFKSLNTSVHENSFCQKMRSCNGAICGSCFASNMEDRYKDLARNNVSNSEILSKYELTERDFPILMDRAFRFHANGELINSLHFRNYLFY